MFIEHYGVCWLQPRLCCCDIFNSISQWWAFTIPSELLHEGSSKLTCFVLISHGSIWLPLAFYARRILLGFFLLLYLDFAILLVSCVYTWMMRFPYTIWACIYTLEVLSWFLLGYVWWPLAAHPTATFLLACLEIVVLLVTNVYICGWWAYCIPSEHKYINQWIANVYVLSWTPIGYVSDP